MAKSTGEAGGTEATTLIFPKKSAWEEAQEAKRAKEAEVAPISEAPVSDPAANHP